MLTRSYLVQVVSLGCAKNLVDTEVMCGVLATDGIVLTPDRDTADLVLVNTCGFIADAREEAEEEIRSALRWKRKRRGRAVAVAGCLPRRIGSEAAAAHYPKVDLFIGLDDVPRAAELIRALRDRTLDGRNLSADTTPVWLYDHTSPRLQLTPQAYAYIKVAEGCDHRCSYCIIPHIRGAQRSRQPESVVAECRQLLEAGVHEIDIIAQDTTRYGRDLDPRVSLVELLKQCDAIPGDFWLRLLYTHPLYVTDELLDLLADSQHIVPYLDIPLQHVATPMLKEMRRGLDGAKQYKLMQRIRERCPGIAVRTTFLVGFPGETDGHFQELIDFVREYRFERLGAFAFSPEEGTPAADSDAPSVPAELAQERRDQLLQIQYEISLERNQGLVGTECKVLIDGVGDDGGLVARTTADAPEVDNLIHIQDGPMIAPRFATVRITDADAYDLGAVLQDK